MPRYSEMIDRVLLQPDLLERLCPSEPLLYDLYHRIRDADDATLSGGAGIKDQEHWRMVRGGLLYAVDALDPAHRIFQDEKSDMGSYWHGMMHRREADFDNARYWFRRAGRLPFFEQLRQQAAPYSPVIARQAIWDPYLFTGECEQAKFGAVEKTPELAKVQFAEWEVAFDYCWRQALGISAPAPE